MFDKCMSTATFAPIASTDLPRDSRVDAELARRRMGFATMIPDRRTAVRFPIEQPVRYRALTSATHDAGTGKTLDMSSNGVLFETEAVFRPGCRLELSVAWPAQLGKTALKLVLEGRVVRSEPGRTAVVVDRYEFRTQGTRAPILSDTTARRPA